MSDVAPAASGIPLVDHARSIQLAEASLKLAVYFLKGNGAFVVKVFQGEDLPNFIARTKQSFETVRVFRPEASRKESDEHYLVCQRPRRESEKPGAPISDATT